MSGDGRSETVGRRLKPTLTSRSPFSEADVHGDWQTIIGKLLNDIVRAQQYGLRDGEAKGFGGLQVDDQLAACKFAA